MLPHLLRLLIISLILMAFAACGGGDDGPETSPPPAETATGSATPETEAIPGILLFAGYDEDSPEDTKGDLFTINSAGDELTNLTNDGAGSGQASFNQGRNFDWSPDGKRIAFGASPNGPSEIFVMDADGSNRYQVSGAGSVGEPRWSPDGKSIAFISGNDGSARIYVVNADGSNEHLLTEGDSHDWSPDGREILFEHNGIKVMNADGTNIRSLRTSDEDYFAPFWSPDGSQIVFSMYKGGANNYLYSQIYVMNRDGSSLTHVPLNADDETHYGGPSWSPDGEWIAYIADDPSLSVYTMTPDGSNISNVSGPLLAGAPDWSPDGGQVAFVGGDLASRAYGVWVVDADGSDLTNIGGSPTEGSVVWSPASGSSRPHTTPVRAGTPSPTPSPTPRAVLSEISGHFGFMNVDETGYGYGIATVGTDGSGFRTLAEEGAFSPAWSPDGAHIAYSSSLDQARQIVVMDASGGNQVVLTNVTDAIADDAAWSPDGSRIAYVVTYFDSRDNPSELYVMEADGSNGRRVTVLGDEMFTGTSFEWSPDGSKLLFMDDPDGSNTDVFVVNADGSGLRNLTNDPGDDAAARWSPDGSRIAFSSRRGATDEGFGGYDIYVMNADGSGQTRLFESPYNDWEPTWSPDGSMLAYVLEAGSGLQIGVVNADGAGLTQITNDTDYEKREVTWSPDGRTIAYVGRDEDGDSNYEIRVMNPDGSGVTVVYGQPGDIRTLSWLP